MSELRGRIFAILAGGWLLATAGAAVLFGFQVLSALIIGGSLFSILIIASVLALVFGFLSYRRNPKRLLSRLNAVPLSKGRVPTVHVSIDRLTDRMGIDRPELYIVHLGQPNAFALGGGTLVVDRSLVRLLTSAELEAILAHELAHLEGHDSLIQTLANSLLRTVTSLTLVVLVPFAVVVSMSCWGSH
jgi:heat shock protein HtpX